MWKWKINKFLPACTSDVNQLFATKFSKKLKKNDKKGLMVLKAHWMVKFKKNQSFPQTLPKPKPKPDPNLKVLKIS